MKNFYAFLLFLLLGNFGFGQSNPGDIAFTAFNADGGDDFSIVALIDIPANTEIYFTDNEPATATTLTTGEGTLLWDSGAALISQGSIIVFTDASSGTRSSSVGTLTGALGSFNLAAGGDALYAFIGTSATAVTAWLAGIQNEANNQGGGFGSTGLTVGTTFINFYVSGSPDGGNYSGPRSGEVAFSNYLTQLGDNTNWTTETSNGELTLPISTAPFTISAGCAAPTTQASAYNTTSIGTTSATLNWTPGDGDEVLVVLKENSAIDTDPTNETTYTGNTVFTSGDEIGTGNYTVLAGTTTSSVSVTGLNPTTTYHVAVYEYNTTDTCYNLTALIGNFTTDCSTPTDVSAFTATSGNTTIDLSWTNETCFDDLLVVAKATSAVTVAPIGDGTTYTADATFGSGTDLGTSEYAVYKGTGTTVTVTGLTNGTTYHFEIFARKGTSWSAGIIDSAIPNSILSTGTLIISEIMNDPSGAEPEGEYFEIYNPGINGIDMNGWVISDNDSDTHTITTTLIVPPNGFIVLGNNSDTLLNGNVILDYVYGSDIALANGADEIILTDGSGTEIDRVEYDAGTLWPNPNGAAMIYRGSDIEDNNDGALWTTATVSEGLIPDFGSPGSNGVDQIVAYLIFVNNSWNSTPTASTGTRIGLIKSNESTSFTTDIALNHLYIKEGADLTITSGNTLALSSVTLESISDSYSSLILDGTVVGTIKYKRFVNANTTGNGNDLISPPLTGQSWADFLTTDSNSTDLLNDGNTAPTTYLFGPFEKSSGTYLAYTDVTSTTLTSGTGYRAGTGSGTTLTFTGTANSGDFYQNIESSGASFTNWNLIGNPYPSYIDVKTFLEQEVATGTGIRNIDIIDDVSGIYGYNADTSNHWTVITLANDDGKFMTPGQGFYLAADPDPTLIANYDITFTNDMRATNAGDDFILNRDANTLTFIKLKTNTATNSYNTEFYFNDNSSRGLDAGYDAKVWGSNAPNFALYSHLVENNTGLPITLQSLHTNDLADVTIPLGVNANQGEQLTFTISEYDLPNGTEVYLEDNVENTTILLSSGDYTLTPSTNLNGTGRFYLHFSNTTLSTSNNTLDNLSIYSNNTDKTIVVAGQLLETTTANLYDIQGRLVSSTLLESISRSQTIDVRNLETGVYLVQLINGTQNKTQKVIIK